MSESSLFLRIQEDVKNAMRAKDSKRLGTLRLLLAAIKQLEVDQRIKLDENQIIAVLDKMVRQRHDSIDQYQKGDRQDLADKEMAEIVVLKEYLPEPLSEEEVTNIINDAVAAIGATSIKDMSRVMSQVKDKVQGRADVGKISVVVKSILEK